MKQPQAPTSLLLRAAATQRYQITAAQHQLLGLSIAIRQHRSTLPCLPAAVPMPLPILILIHALAILAHLSSHGPPIRLRRPGAQVLHPHALLRLSAIAPGHINALLPRNPRADVATLKRQLIRLQHGRARRCLPVRQTRVAPLGLHLVVQQQLGGGLAQAAGGARGEFLQHEGRVGRADAGRFLRLPGEGGEGPVAEVELGLRRVVPVAALVDGDVALAHGGCCCCSCALVGERRLDFGLMLGLKELKCMPLTAESVQKSCSLSDEQFAMRERKRRRILQEWLEPTHFATLKRD
ncbi:hypothetical protein IWX90DRAFT_264206 [Phyllosticta citrichinensis]|uniref:Uncharacterized protein n=1 Tax=Phyllosticta citrichinensis TaxID=1130410 RepID=A0ABR1XSB1_9PEZI